MARFSEELDVPRTWWVTIALEQFHEPGLPQLGSATRLEPIHAALDDLAIPTTQRLTLLGSQATTTAIASKVRQLGRQLQNDDRVWVVVTTAHLFGPDGLSLLGVDVQPNDLAKTVLPWTTLLRSLRPWKKSPQVILWIDSVSPTFALPKDFRPVVLSDWAAWLDEPIATNVSLILARTTDDEELASVPGQPRWFIELLATLLRAEVPDATDTSGQVTPATLTTFLAKQPQRIVRKRYQTPLLPSPRLLSRHACGEALLDLAALLARRSAKPEVDLSQLRRVVLRSITHGRIKELAGFTKMHRVPDSANAAAQKFLARIALPDLKNDIDEMYEMIRDRFAFLRKDLEASVERDGTGFIRSPHFEYTVSLTLLPEDPSSVVWTREVSGIRDAQTVRSPAFQAVFGTTFDTLQMEFATPVDLDGLIDHLESASVPHCRVRASSDGQRCEVTLAGFVGSIIIEPTTLTIASRRSGSVASLIDQFLEFIRLFPCEDRGSLLPIGPAKC